MAAFREVLTIDSFTAFGTKEKTQNVQEMKVEDETAIWLQAAITLRTQ